MAESAPTRKERIPLASLYCRGGSGVERGGTLVVAQGTRLDHVIGRYERISSANAETGWNHEESNLFVP